MYEDRPEKDTPQHINDMLREYGGVNPHGEPIWRLVLAENCRVRCYGWLNHMPDGFKASGLPETTRPDTIEPVRIEDGEHWVPRYRVKGWILQRWFPPSTWGLRRKWEEEKARDGKTRLLAAYPQAGDYMMVKAGPWKTLDAIGDLRAAIRAYNLIQRNNPVNWENYILAQAAMDEQDRQQQADEYAAEMAAQYREGFAGVLRSASTSAQSVRNVIARHTAGGVNLGASEKWGA